MAIESYPSPQKGILKKWTNYVSGWQERWFEVTNGNLVYYKTKADKYFGCRGSLCLKSVNVTEHEFDECEFTVSVGSNLVWYLKAESRISKDMWMKAIMKDTGDSDYSSTSTKSHSRNNSSLSSVDLIQNCKDTGDQLISHVAELEAYRTMCSDQMRSLQRLLENESSVSSSWLLSLKATHLAMQNNIDRIIEMVKNKKVLPSSSDFCTATTDRRFVSFSNGGKEIVDSCSEQTFKDVSPANGSTIDALSDGGDEWHDADEHSSFSSIEGGIEARPSSTPSPGCETSDSPSFGEATKFIMRNLPFGHYDSLEMPRHHKLFDFVDSLAMEQLKYALAGVEDNVWSLFAEDGAMRMYTREVQDEGGLPVDPLKAVHQVKGVTALEFMHYFYDTRFKRDWDHTLNDMSVIEEISRDTVVLHQKHKTVWPAAPRESLFVSHIRRVDSFKKPESAAHDLYIVCNKDIIREDVPLASSSSVRVGLTVSMICETVIVNKKPLNELSREDVYCNITYVSQVHPGGWVPVAALRHVYKKEYPKFLRTFTDYVLQRVAKSPVAL